MNPAALITLCRLRHWIKNAFVLGPLLFSGLFTATDAVLQAFFATVMVCLAASATYVLNDLLDVAADRAHPVKSVARPIANGSVSTHHAVVLLVVLYAVMLSATLINFGVMVVVIVYVLINIAYTVKL